jgi:hypothetical protein
MRPEDFTGAYGERMYLLFMAIRPEALPTDAACGFRFIPAGFSDVKPATVPI